MRRYWWTVWIKVAVLAFVLFLGYRYAKNKIEDFVSPYLIDESKIEQTLADDKEEESSKVSLEESEDESDEGKGVDTGNLLMSLLGKIEKTFDVKIDFENMIFDYANEYAQKMKEESKEEQNPIMEPLS